MRCLHLPHWNWSVVACGRGQEGGGEGRGTRSVANGRLIGGARAARTGTGRCGECGRGRRRGATPRAGGFACRRRFRPSAATRARAARHSAPRPPTPGSSQRGSSAEDGGGAHLKRKRKAEKEKRTCLTEEGAASNSFFSRIRAFSSRLASLASSSGGRLSSASGAISPLSTCEGRGPETKQTRVAAQVGAAAPARQARRRAGRDAAAGRPRPRQAAAQQRRRARWYGAGTGTRRPRQAAGAAAPRAGPQGWDSGNDGASAAPCAADQGWLHPLD